MGTVDDLCFGALGCLVIDFEGTICATRSGGMKGFGWGKGVELGGNDAAFVG